jgi:hypothetical protein
MTDASERHDQREPESLDREAQRRREAGANGAEADKIPEPGPSRYKDDDRSGD